MSGLLAVTRAIHLASLMVIFGASAFPALLQRAGRWEAPPRSSRFLGTAAALVALVTAIVWFCLIAGQMSGSSQGAIDPAVLQLAATDTRFGHIFVGRTIGLVALSLLCALETRSKSFAVAVLAGLLLASLAPVSHAAAGGDNVLTMGAVSDGVHLLAGGFWLGGLVVLASLVARYRSRAAELVAQLGVFSSWGGFVVALLVLTGVANLLLIMPVSAMSLHNLYFDLLLTKIGLAAVMVGLAALNRWRFAPAFARGENAVRHLAYSIGLETAFAFTVVGIVGYLGTIAPH
jgi:putative copper resistance protein D